MNSVVKARTAVRWRANFESIAKWRPQRQSRAFTPASPWTCQVKASRVWRIGGSRIEAAAYTATRIVGEHHVRKRPFRSKGHATSGSVVWSWTKAVAHVRRVDGDRMEREHRVEVSGRET